MSASGGGSGDGGRAGSAGQTAQGGASGASNAGRGGSAGAARAQAVYVSNGTGEIHVLALDLTSGQVSAQSVADGSQNPSYMAFSADSKFAYAINEANQSDSKALAFGVDASDGHLTPLNSVLTGATGAPHLAVHPSGKWLAVAHYGRDTDMWVGGQTVVIPIATDGSLGTPGEPATGPADDKCKNAHQAVFSSDGSYLLVPCLGSDYVVQYVFDKTSGALSLNTPPTVKVPMGVGPRHLALDPAQEHAYLITEHGNTVVWYKYDSATGRLTDPKTLDSTKVAKASDLDGWGAHIVVHPSGKWLYTSNRKESATRGSENSIGVFTLDAQGVPTPVPDAFVTDMIDIPRDFSIDPTGQYLFVVNEAGAQNLLVFRIDASTGGLTRTQAFAIGGKPAFVRAITLP